MKRDMSRWIKVEDRLPDFEVMVLAYAPRRSPSVNGVWAAQLSSKYNGGTYWQDAANEDFDIAGVTHWMPLPEPPTPLTTTTIEAPDPAPPQVEVKPDVEVVLRFIVPYAKAGPYLEDIDGIQERIREDYFQDATDFNWSMGLE